MSAGLSRTETTPVLPTARGPAPRGLPAAFVRDFERIVVRVGPLAGLARFLLYPARGSMQSPTISAARYVLPHPHELARRQSPRVALEAAVTYARGLQRGSGHTLNLGLGGMAIQSASPPAVGETTLLVVRLPDTQPLPFTGVVRWSSAGSFGIQYGPLGGPQTRALVQLLARGNAFR